MWFNFFAVCGLFLAQVSALSDPLPSALSECHYGFNSYLYILRAGLHVRRNISINASIYASKHIYDFIYIFIT